jgi:hypothetical protein
MGLGIYMDNLSEWEDTGEEVSGMLGKTYIPDFKSRSTLQTWRTTNEPKVRVDRWVGESLADDSAHEIYIINKSLPEVKITFLSTYSLNDEEEFDSVILKLNEVAHFYAAALSRDNKKVLVMRTGSQDTRK